MSAEQAAELGQGIAGILNHIAQQEDCMTPPRHFLTLMDLKADEIRSLIKRAIELKSLRDRGLSHRTLEGKVLAMILPKPQPEPEYLSRRA